MGAGSCIVDKRLVWSSVSQIAKFNPVEDGCNLRWFYRYRMGWAEPPKAANDNGIKVHSQVEFYEKTGSDVLGKVALQGKHLLPAPGKDLLVEWGLHDQPRPPDKNGKQVNWYEPKESKVWAGDIPLVGFADLINARQQYMQEDETLLDMPGVVEALDHKTSSDGTHAKTGEQLLTSTQMLGCGKFAAVKYPWATSIKLSHLYYLTKPKAGAKRAFLRSTNATIALLDSLWDKTVVPVVQQMKVVAAAEEREVKGNLEACNNFGGCPYKRNCRVYGALTVKQKLVLQYGTNLTNQEVKAMSLINRVRAVAPAGAVPPPINGAVPAPAAPPPPVVAAQPLPAAPAPSPVLAQNLYAQSAVQGQMYMLPNGIGGQFLSGVPFGNEIKYSFLPVGGGAPIHLSANDIISTWVGPLPTPVTLAPVVVVPPPAPPPPPVVAAPPGIAAGAPPWVGAPPPPPAPPAARQRTQITDVPTPPPAAAAPAAAPAAPATTPKLGRGKKAADAAAATPPASVGVSVEALQDAIETAKEIFNAHYGLAPTPEEIFNAHYGLAPTPEQLVPIWQALLGIG